MTNETIRSAISRTKSQHLRYAGAALGFVVAAVHLFHPTHGFGRFVTILAADPGLFASHPRSLAFVLSGLAIVLGINYALVSGANRTIYALGAGLMAVYVVGYLGWHLSGHGGFLPNRRPIYHGLAPHEAVIAHLTTDPWAAVALVTELALLAVLVVLYRRET